MHECFQFACRRAETLEGNLRRMFCEELVSEQSRFVRPISMTLIPGQASKMLDGPSARSPVCGLRLSKVDHWK